MKNLIVLISFCLATVSLMALGTDPVSAGVISLVGGAAVGEFVKANPGLTFNIPLQDARNVFTKSLVKVYKEKTSPTSFLRSFFPTTTSMSKEISIQVQRGTEYVAVDVERGTNGNRNTFETSTEKILVPPFYWEYLTANEHRLYDIAIGMQNETGFVQLAQELAEDLFKLRQKIERAYELQCAQVLDTGIVQLNADTNIDFKRKAGSLVDLSGTPWDNNANNPLDHLENAGNWLRQNGKAMGGVFNVIMSADAFNAFKGNTNVTGQADIRRFELDSLRAPQANSVGGVLHGEVSAGSYKFRIWTYPEYYQDSDGNMQPYITAKKVIIMPEAPNFILSFAAVPQLLENGQAPQRGEYLVQEFIDQRATAHEYHIKSAGIAVPVGVDQIYTAQVLA